MRRSSLCALLALLAPALAAQETPQAPTPPTTGKLQSGPPKGRRLGELQVVAVVGPRSGQQYDAAAAMQRGPAAILFVHELTRNVAPMLRAFDEIGAELLPMGLVTASVRLGADRTQMEQHTPLVVQSLRMRTPMLVTADGAEGPGAYALNRKAALTLVLARDGLVQDSLAFTDTGLNDADLLRVVLSSLCGPPPLDPAELQQVLHKTLPQDREELAALVTRLELDRRRLAEQVRELQQRLQEARAGGGGPMDTVAPGRMRDATEPLAGAFRRLAAADTTAEAAAEALQQVDAILQRQPDRREQARRLAERVLQDSAAGEATKEALRKWLERHAP